MSFKLRDIILFWDLRSFVDQQVSRWILYSSHAIKTARGFCRAGAAMLHPDVEPKSPVYHSEFGSGGEQTIGASGAGGGGDPSYTEGELVEGPSLEEA